MIPEGFHLLLRQFPHRTFNFTNLYITKKTLNSACTFLLARVEEHRIFIEALDDFKRKPHLVKDPSNQT